MTTVARSTSEYRREHHVTRAPLSARLDRGHFQTRLDRPLCRYWLVTTTPTLIRTREVAEILGVHRNTVRRLAELGILRSERTTPIPRSPRRYRLEDVERIARDRQVDNGGSP
jgi:excisionase family DNA binding protein